MRNSLIPAKIRRGRRGNIFARYAGSMHKAKREKNIRAAPRVRCGQERKKRRGSIEELFPVSAGIVLPNNSRARVVNSSPEIRMDSAQILNFAQESAGEKFGTDGEHPGFPAHRTVGARGWGERQVRALPQGLDADRTKQELQKYPAGPGHGCRLWKNS